MKEVLFTKYSNERDPRFAIRTSIIEDSKKNKRYVEKTAVTKEAEGHVQNMLVAYEKLSEYYKGTDVQFSKCKIKNGVAVFDYIDGNSLGDKFEKLVENEDYKGILELYKSFEDIVKKGKILTASVQGDFHDIGKNLCILMLESNGFQVIDMGVDVPQEKIEECIKKESPNILMLSAMIAPTMEVMKMTIEYLREKGVTENLKIMVGGAPLTEETAKSMGAAYSADAVSAVEVAEKLLNI